MDGTQAQLDAKTKNTLRLICNDLKISDRFEYIERVTRELRDFEASGKRKLKSTRGRSKALEKVADAAKKLAMAIAELEQSQLHELLSSLPQDGLEVSRGLECKVPIAEAAAFTQLIQGLHSGVLRGDNFNSVMRQAPSLAKSLADHLNIPIDSLLCMAEEGGLTTQTIIDSIQGKSQPIWEVVSIKDEVSYPVDRVSHIGLEAERLASTIQKMIEQSGTTGSKGGRTPTLNEYADYVGRVAFCIGGTDMNVGRNGDFERLCEAVFDAAGVQSEPEGAIRRYSEICNRRLNAPDDEPF